MARQQDNNNPPQRPQRQLNETESAHNDILKNFADPDDADDDDLRTGANEESIFEDDVDDNEPPEEVRDDDTGDDDVDDNEDELATAPVVDDDTRKNEQFKFKQDREGNFIDKDGNIVVRKGKQRDLFVKIKKAYNTERGKVEKISQDFQETVSAAKLLLKRYNELKATKNFAESVGLSEDEAKTAAEVHALIKLDPKAGVRKILTMLHLGGTDLSEIGVTGPLDAKTVAEHVVAIQEAKRPKEKSEEDKAAEIANAFLERHPSARQYVGALAEAKRRFPVMTYDEIWYQLLLHAKQRGQQQQSNGADEGQRPPGRTFPRNSNRATGVVADRGKKLSLKSVDPSQSFSQIGRDLLRDLNALER